MRTKDLNNQRKVFENLQKHKGEVRVLDLGCGLKKFPGATGLDIFFHQGIDVISNIDREHLPFRDKSFDMVVANHVIEHVLDIKAFVTEIYRVLDNGGILVIRTPYFAHEGSFRDPSHRWHLTLKSMDYFLDESPLRWHGLPGYFHKECVRLEFGKDLSSRLGKLLASFSLNVYEKNIAHIFPAEVVFWALRKI